MPKHSIQQHNLSQFNGTFAPGNDRKVYSYRLDIDEKNNNATAYTCEVVQWICAFWFQEDAALEVHQFIPLIKIECSPDLKLFLCSLYAPLCTILDYAIPPCRSLCESARNCEKIMKTFDFMWPESLECSKFPEYAPEELCISPNSSAKSDQNAFSTPVSVLHKQDRKTGNSLVDHKPNSTSYSHRLVGFVCPVQLKAPQVMGYELNVAGKVVKDCGAPCNSLFFNEEERTTLRYWISSWAAISVASCLFTVSFIHLNVTNNPKYALNRF